MVENNALALLQTIGIDSPDTAMLSAITSDAEIELKTRLRREDVPTNVLSRYIVGEYLRMALQIGTLDLNGLNLSSSPSSIKVGDTQVGFSGDDSPSGRVMALVEEFTSQQTLSRYRKLG